MFYNELGKFQDSAILAPGHLLGKLTKLTPSPGKAPKCTHKPSHMTSEVSHTSPSLKAMDRTTQRQ